jgi:hypothetical protein
MTDLEALVVAAGRYVEARPVLVRALDELRALGWRNDADTCFDGFAALALAGATPSGLYACWGPSRRSAKRRVGSSSSIPFLSRERALMRARLRA